LTVPITVDFTDCSGSAATGSLRMNFNLNNCNVEGFTSVNPTGVTPGQTGGTMQINFFFPQLQAPAGNTLLLSFWLTTSQGVESNIITGAFLSGEEESGFQEEEVATRVESNIITGAFLSQ